MSAADAARTLMMFMSDNVYMYPIRVPARKVPLGGVRDMQVFRTLPDRRLVTVGPWCFIDEAGPEAHVARVLPHPHTGLQTVTWPISGEIRHRDSLGTDVIVRPGQLNLMTARAGIAHSEFSVSEQIMPLHLLQFWVALPQQEIGQDTSSSFEHHSHLPEWVADSGNFTACVFLGELAGVASPATVFSPLVGADVTGTGAATIPLQASFEYAVLLLAGRLTVNGKPAKGHELLYLPPGASSLNCSADEARFILLGGEPFTEPLVMWWNFIGRSHADIVSARADWESGSARFGVVSGHGEARIPAPPLPPVTLKPRLRQR